MAKLSIDIVKNETRQFTSSRGVELTDEIFEEMSLANQVLVNLHEKFVGEVEKVGEYEGRYFVQREQLEAVAKVFKL